MKEKKISGTCNFSLFAERPDLISQSCGDPGVNWETGLCCSGSSYGDVLLAG